MVVAAGCAGLSTPTTVPPTATSVAAPAPAEPDVIHFIPDSAHIVRQIALDLDGDGMLEYVILAGFGGSPDRLGYDWLQFFIVEPDRPGYEVAWQSAQLPTDRAEELLVADINGDGRMEVVSVQSMGASGQTMYVLAWRGEAFDFLRPQGGFFAGRDSFGDNAVRLEDLDGDGVMEILAGYGPMASLTDVYGWNGEGYAFLRTADQAH
jgi:hypothetical protein